MVLAAEGAEDAVRFLVLDDGAAVAVVGAGDAAMARARVARRLGCEAGGLLAVALEPVAPGVVHMCEGGCLTLLSERDGALAFHVPIGGGFSVYCLPCARRLVAVTS